MGMTTDTKYCPRCKKTLPRDAFKNSSKSRATGVTYQCRSPYCRGCTRTYMKGRKELGLATTRNIKTKIACVDCERYYPHWMMQFDHVRGVKKFNVSNSRGGMDALMEEIAKCDVRCANCHHNRTHYRRHPDTPFILHKGDEQPVVNPDIFLPQTKEL